MPTVHIRVSLLLAAITLAAAGCPPPPTGADPLYRGRMRDFVQALSAYAKAADAGFLVVPQNGDELLTTDGDAAGPLASAYVAAIDGFGREDLFYGYTADNVATPANATNRMLGFLDRAETAGIEVLVTDYCSGAANVDASYAGNAAHGFISFAADSRELDRVPAYPAVPYNVSPANVTALAIAQNFLYLINPGAFATRTAYLNALRATNHDVLIVDFAYDGTPLTTAEVASLKSKANGGTRLVLAYMSIGEAEDYRFYWDPAWTTTRPAWLLDENPDWPGNYTVRFWDAGWHAVIYGSASAYLDRILAAGFDGVYLDKVDVYEEFEAKGSCACEG
jgi:cysteinyl-tRNA synthetase